MNGKRVAVARRVASEKRMKAETVHLHLMALLDQVTKARHLRQIREDARRRTEDERVRKLLMARNHTRSSAEEAERELEARIRE